MRVDTHAQTLLKQSEEQNKIAELANTLDAQRSIIEGLENEFRSFTLQRSISTPIEEKVSIAVLQLQLTAAETARATLEETVTTLRERVSKLEGLIEFLLKAKV